MKTSPNGDHPLLPCASSKADAPTSTEKRGAAMLGFAVLKASFRCMALASPLG